MSSKIIKDLLKVIYVTLFVTFFCTLNGCLSSDVSKEKIKKAEKDIHNCLAKQQKAWNTGDIDGFMKYYWKSDSLKFVSKKGISYGWEKVLQNYKKGYPTAEKMGQLEFKVQSFKVLSEDHALLIGSWDLSYPDQPNMGGYFSLIWKKQPEGWRIIIDHTS